MKKLFFIGWVFVVTFFAVPVFGKSTAVSVSSFGGSGLSERLAADKDFQDFSLYVYSLFGKLKETKSSHLFKRFVSNAATEADLAILAGNLGYTGKKDFFKSLERLALLKTEVTCKFPELMEGTESINKVIESAALKVVEKIKKPELTTAECWLYWTTGLFACSQYCAYVEDYDTCWWSCSAAMSAAAGMCMLEAD